MMEKIKNHRAVKAVLYVLAALLLTVGLTGGLFTLRMSGQGYYWESIQEMEKAMLHGEASEAAWEIYDRYSQNVGFSDYQESNGYMFRLEKEDGTVVGQSSGFSEDGSNTRYTETWSYDENFSYDDEMTNALQNGAYGYVETKTVQEDIYTEETYVEPVSVPDTRELPDGYIADEDFQVYRIIPAVNITVQVKNELEQGSTLWMQISSLYFWYNSRYLVPAVAGICLVLGLAALALLLSAAGRRAGSDGIQTGILEKVPFDILSLFWAGFFVLGISVVPENLNNIFYIVLEVLEVFGVTVLCLLYLHSAVIRIKRGELLKGWFILRVWKWYKRWAKKWAMTLQNVFSQLPLIWKSLIVIGVITVLELLIILTSGSSYEYAFFWFVERLVLIPAIIYIILTFRKLQTAAEKIAAGEEGVSIDTDYVYGSLRSFAETLNHIYDGLGQAVEARMKSERLRTELITNVSHDIKTPLTSIVSYVDLLKKEELPEGAAREYVEVLDRQSGRLKKLIEDLVEASKAATGNMTVNMEVCDIKVLLNQSIAEYQDKLEKAELQVIVKQPDENVSTLADGRHMWRIFDNLFQNICKYAMPSTRVYLNLEKTENQIRIIFRNISRYPLEIPADELMERFTRGDSSRHTEGSGLGLSIASSLAALQQGSLELVTDGDLFKVILTFPVRREKGGTPA